MQNTMKIRDLILKIRIRLYNVFGLIFDHNIFMLSIETLSVVRKEAVISSNNTFLHL